MSGRSLDFHRILYVDNNVEFLTIVPLYLHQRLHVDVSLTFSPRHAIAILEASRQFDLIISDYVFPKGTGDDLLRYLEVEEIMTPVIFFTVLDEIKRDDFPSSHLLSIICKTDLAGLSKAVERTLCLS